MKISILFFLVFTFSFHLFHLSVRNSLNQIDVCVYAQCVAMAKEQEDEEN